MRFPISDQCDYAFIFTAHFLNMMYHPRAFSKAAVIDQTLAVCDVDLAFNRRQSGLGEETLILKGNFLLKIIISSIKKCQGDTNRATILSP